MKRRRVALRHQNMTFKAMSEFRCAGSRLSMRQIIGDAHVKQIEIFSFYMTSIFCLTPGLDTESQQGVFQYLEIVSHHHIASEILQGVGGQEMG